MKSKLFFIISLILICNIVFGQNSDDTLNELKLSDFGLYPYPTLEELKENKLDEKYLLTTPISFDDINTNFSNINDLEWLREIARKNKVILFGEEHYHRYILNLRNRILFAINTFDYYPLLIMEAQYSISPFVNYYINIVDDVEADNYLTEVIYEMITTKEQYLLLQHIRRWNKINPDKKIAVGYSDIEHDFKTTIRNIILPYLSKVNDDLSVDVDNLTHIELGELVTKFIELNKIAKEKNIIGEFPFITANYISNVIENLNSTYKSYYFEFNYYRQKAMIRNITDPEFLGDYIINSKVMIHCGGYHTPTHFYYPDNGNFYREGSYLSFDFEPTKGKTYSIEANGLARSIGEMAEVSLDSCLHQGSSYRRIISKIQKAYKKKLISKEDFVLGFEINDFQKLIIKNAIDNNNEPLLFEKIDWKYILKVAKERDKNLFRNLKHFHDEFKRYDKYIIVPRSPMTTARFKKS